MNPFMRKAIKEKVSTNEMARNELSSSVRIREQIRIGGASLCVEKEFDRASQITSIEVGENDLFGFETKKEFGDDGFVGIQDKTSANLIAQTTFGEKRIANVCDANISVDNLREESAGNAESSNNVTDKSKRPFHISEIEEAGVDVARGNKLIKTGQCEANDNARA